MTAVIYARYSSDSQREASIEGQLRDCKDYAEKNGITVVGTYIDRAYSAKTDDRPDFQRMIKDSAKKIFDVVLVWKLDRFARNRFDAVNYKYQLEKNGVHLVSAMEPISQGPEGIMVESMLIGMAEYYSAELALKVARGERENALQCKYNGGVVPLGFTIGKEDRLYHIDPETAPIVQEIFSRYADGEPAEKIAASLNERGLRTRTGKPFVKNSFFQIFRNRRYIGEYRYKDIVTPGGIPAIVDKDLFDRVQQRFEQNRIAHGRPAKEDVSYLLTTKLFCGKCGTLMGGESGTSHMGNTYYYYKCGNAKRHGKAHCDLKAIRKEPLERFVVDTAIKVIFSDEIIERLIDLVMEAQQQENTRLPVLKDQLRDTEKRLANLLEAIEQGILTPTTKQRLDELEARKEALNTSILEEELKKPVLTREWIRFWLEKFRKGDVGSTEHQRQIIDTFVNSVYVFDDRVVLNFNFTDDAKTVTREEVLGSSAVDNAPPLAQIRVTNTVDFKSKSTVFLCLSASKFIAILQILCKIKVEVHMDLVSAINFYPADKLADDHLFCFKAGTIVQVCVRDQFFVQLRYICHQFSVSLQFCTGFFTQSVQLRVLLFLCCDHLGKSVFRKSTLPFDYSQNLSF
ncbi:MAG: recombinase family protein [Faecalibacterium prausnitzii]